MRLRSLLFVPGDRSKRFAKAAGSGADALILHLEDLVTPERKGFACEAVRNWLSEARGTRSFVRVNPIGGNLLSDDLAAGAGVFK